MCNCGVPEIKKNIDNVREIAQKFATLFQKTVFIYKTEKGHYDFVEVGTEEAKRYTAIEYLFPLL